MANARPTGKLTTGAIGNFLLGAAMVLMVLSGASAMFSGGGSGGMGGAGILGLVAFLFIVGGGICGALGWFGLGSIYGGTNTLAGIFSLIFAIVPIALIVLGSSGGVGGGMGMLVVLMILFFAPPALLGIFGGLGSLSAKSGLAKPAGLVLLIGGIATAAIAVLGLLRVDLGSFAAILAYVGFFGLAIGFFLAGATMLSERAES